VYCSISLAFLWLFRGIEFQDSLTLLSIALEYAALFLVYSGVVLRRWKPLVADVRADIELVVLANHVQVTNEQKTNVLLTKELVGKLACFCD
jgi:hypothetical protein